MEVMLLNVARWLKTRPVHNRLVYNVHDASAPCLTLFDAARHLVYAGAALRPWGFVSGLGAEFISAVGVSRGRQQTRRDCGCAPPQAQFCSLLLPHLRADSHARTLSHTHTLARTHAHTDTRRRRRERGGNGGACDAGASLACLHHRRHRTRTARAAACRGGG